jgi:hypothetical protein
VYLVMTLDFEKANSVQLDDRFPIIDVKNDKFPYYRGKYMKIIINLLFFTTLMSIRVKIRINYQSLTFTALVSIQT